MFLGRAGAIAASRRRKKPVRPVEHNPLDYNETKEISKYRLRFRKVPVAIYFTAGFAFFVALFLLYHFHFGSIFSTYKETFRVACWYEYLVVVLIVALGYLFICVAEVEETLIDRVRGVLRLRRSQFGCRGKQATYLLEDVKEVFAVKRGVRSASTDTVHYRVRVEFHNRSPCSFLECKEVRKVKTLVALIRRFIGMDKHEYDDVVVRNEARNFL